MPDIPCPHCGQLNEQEREVCWACSKLLKPKEAPAEKFDIPGSMPMPPLPMPEPFSSSPGIVSRTINTNITVNGKESANLEEVPEPFRASLKNSLASAQQAMKSGKKSRIVVNDKEYERLEDVPEQFRSKLKEGIAQAKPIVVKSAPSGISTFNIGPFTFQSYGTYINEPLDLDPNASLPPPQGFRLDDNGLERRISWRWISWSSVIGIYFAAIFGVPFAFVLLICLHSPADAPWPLLVPLGLPPAVVVYAWLCYLINRTTLRVDAARVSVRHGPLPYWGAKDILKADIAQVFSEKRIDTRNSGQGGALFEPRFTYMVKLLLKGGKTLKLVTGLLAPEQAMFIEQQIRRA